MEKGIRVKDIVPGSRAQGVFTVRAAASGCARNGKIYWNLTLADASGAIEAKIWSPLAESFSEIPGGCFARACGLASLYRDKCQLVIESLEFIDKAEEAGLDMAEYMPASPHSVEEMFSELRILVENEFRHPPWKRLMTTVLADFQDGLRKAPAAISVHHAYAGGLLEHTLSVARLCQAIAGLYPELDRQTLLAGAILHDLGKIRELAGGAQMEYTREGQLTGHIFLGLLMIEPRLEESDLEPWLREHLRHLILSHHGQPEFGAARLPQTAEAFALHYADNLDARLAQCRALFSANTEAPAWSGWVKTLERSVLYPQRTPADAEPPANGGANMDQSGNGGEYPPLPDGEEDDFWENDVEPDYDELNEIYADPDFNAWPGEERETPRENPGGKNGAQERRPRQDNQCSLL